MSVDPVLLQGALAIPISTGLVVYTLLRWDRRVLHVLLTTLLATLTLWLVGTVVKLAPGPDWLRLAGLDLEVFAVIFMPALFMITMAHFARSPLFELSPAPALALLTVSGVFLLAFLTDDLHGLMIADRSAALAGAHVEAWAGPFYWGLQMWIGLCDLGGIGYCVSVLYSGRTRTERGRAAVILGATTLPIAAHIAHLLHWPVDFTLAPSSIALTAAFFVHGVHHYGLLGGQTIVRHDLIEHLDAGLLLADEHGTVLDANRSAERLVGASREHMRGVALPEVLALLEPDEASRDVGERIVGLPLDGSRVDAEVHAADGRVIELVAGAVPSLGSQPAGRFVSLVDRTAQRRNEKLLRERQKLESVGILAAGVAHEVNNPLAYVRANLVHLRALADALQKPDVEGEAEDARVELPGVIDESVEGIDRIARIVESMLRFARTSDESFRRVDVGRVVDEALRLAALQRDTTVRVERLGGPVPPVLGSAERLVQVLLNLFLNARQALGGRDDGVIAAETVREGDHVLVHVRDNGPGIPPELQQRIFDPFFTTRGPDSGTGLGLSIAFDIVREHGGTLEVSSKVGAGSCFTVRIAAALEEATA